MENNNESVINVKEPQSKEEEICSCLICLKNDGEIYKYNHTCGRYWIHRHCAGEWFMEHPNECLICRQPIFNDEELGIIENNFQTDQTDQRREIRRPNPIIINRNPVVYIPENQTLCCPNKPCLNVSMLVILIMLFYNLLVYLLK